MIRKASISDLKNIKAITEACALALSAQGIYQWNEHYPSLEKLKTDILQEELFILVKKDCIAGMIVITPVKDKEYIPVKWLTKSENNLYIHRLAVHPDHWGMGYARQLMDFAETQAKQQQYESVRLDTFSQNIRNQRFYEARGYKKLGNIYFPKQSEHPFYCYELLF